MATKDYPLTWELDSLAPHPEKAEFQALLETYRGDLEQLALESEQLPAVLPTSPSTSKGVAGQWAEFLERMSALFARSEELHAFLNCHGAVDAENKLFQQLEGTLAALSPLRVKILTNIEFALKELTGSDPAGNKNDPLETFIQSDARLSRIGFFLHESRRNAALRLPKEQELLAADLSVDGLQAWSRLYDRLCGELRIEVMEKGELVRKSPGQVHFDAPERSLRQNNFFAANKAWNSIGQTCADALNHISGARLAKYRRLGVQDHLDAPLRLNRLRRETLQTMWDVVTQRKSVLLKYFQRKAELLGLAKLSWYDLQAPLPSPSPRSAELSYDAACNMVFDTFSAFSPDLGDFARMAVRERWIEVENRAGKRQGGFCTGFPVKQQSRIFMTYTQTPDSMSTLAHELGHAYHSWVLKEEPFLLQDYPMNLAETASTFAEAVLGDQRLQAAQSRHEKLAILDNMLGDDVAFLMNIHARFLFEDNFHRERQQGELSVERLNELMQSAQQEAFNDGLATDGWYPGFWISKLHFYISSWPFYNFPYTFGYLLSQGVYALAQQSGKGEDFPARYRKLLIATGCQATEEAVSTTLGDDLTRPDFWHRSLNLVDQRVEQFLKLSEVR